MTGSALSCAALVIGHHAQPVAGPLDAAFAPGEVHLLTGPNGSGKTTLLRSLVGLQPILRGRIDRDPNATVSYVPQLQALDGGFPVTCGEVVQTGRRVREPRSRAVACARDALAAVGLDDFVARSFFRLSGGQRQRVLVARALYAEADIVALDEPTAGVDAESSGVLWSAVRDLARAGKLVVAVTHDLFRAPRVADRILVLDSEGLRESAPLPIAGTAP